MIFSASVLVLTGVGTFFLLQRKKVNLGPALVIFLFGYTAYTSSFGPTVGNFVTSVVQLIQNIRI